MTSPERRLSTPLPFVGSAPLPVQAGPSAPNPHAPPPLSLALLALTNGLSGASTAIPAPPLPDAGLLRLCATFHDADARCEGSPNDGRDWKVWLDRRWEATAAIEAMTPRTNAGRQAKARVALVLLEEAIDTSNEYERFVLATLRDLVGSAAA